MNIDFSDKWLKIYDKLDKDGRLVIHAFGAYVVKDTPDAIAQIQRIAKEYSSKGKNFRLTNIKIFVARMAKLGVVAVVDPYWHFYIKEYADVLNDVIGENRQKAQYPLKSFLKQVL